MRFLFDDPRDRLAMHPGDVAALTGTARERRLDELIGQAHDILSAAIEENVRNLGLTVAAVGVGFSGGNDSTTLTHIFREQVDFALHANTTIGIEETREFVRNTCEEWGISLLERTPPRVTDQYRHLVLTTERGKKGQALGGFPGPAMHFKMYQRLKERAIEQVQREVLTNSRRERFVLILGRRRTESERRSTIRTVDIRGARVNVSPLVNWTKLDLNTYRLRCHRNGNPLPRNTASDVIHMSGECLCGSFAAPGEREEIAHWFPGPFESIAELEALMKGRTDIPEHRKTWGWGADASKKRAETEYLKQFNIHDEESRSGLMCSSCNDRFQQPSLDLGVIA